MSSTPITAEQLAREHLAKILAPGPRDWTRRLVSVQTHYKYGAPREVLELEIYPDGQTPTWMAKMGYKHSEMPKGMAYRTSLLTGGTQNTTPYYEQVIGSVENFAAEAMKEYLCWSLEHAREIALAHPDRHVYFSDVYPFGTRLSNVRHLEVAIALIEPEDLPKYILLATDERGGETVGFLQSMMLKRMEAL